jgi:hypothetical protein
VSQYHEGLSVQLLILLKGKFRKNINPTVDDTASMAIKRYVSLSPFPIETAKWSTNPRRHFMQYSTHVIDSRHDVYINVAACVIAIAVLVLPTDVTRGQVLFHEDFERYELDRSIPAQSNQWKDFGGTQPINPSSVKAHSGSKSMALLEGIRPRHGSDVFLNFTEFGGPFNSGRYRFSYWRYIPSSVNSIAKSSFSELEIDPSSPPETHDALAVWEVHGGEGNIGTAVVRVFPNGGLGASFGPAPVTDQWAEVELLFDLDEQRADVILYGGTAIPAAFGSSLNGVS